MVTVRVVVAVPVPLLVVTVIVRVQLPLTPNRFVTVVVLVPVAACAPTASVPAGRLSARQSAIAERVRCFIYYLPLT
jgi:hypothetical protein